MSKQTINVGSGELVGDGEGIRTAFIKINSNFNELYSNTSTGYTGSIGYAGSRGNVGYTGSASTGTTGYTGSQGNVGYTGSASTGTTGYTGSQGNVGYTGSAGSNTTTNILTTGTPSTAIDLTKQVALLEGQNGSGVKNYTLADGLEGQIMYFAFKQYWNTANPPDSMGITVTISNARLARTSYPTSNFVWQPFDPTTSEWQNTANFAIFTNGAWTLGSY